MQRWHGPGGYRHMLSVGLPLVMSMISHSVMQFTDRIFLANYSIDAIAASLPGSITSFLFLSFFMGIAEYVSVFVAQYTGAVQHEKVGSSLWQGIWASLPAAAILASLALVAQPLFELGGHPANLIPLEVAYFNILTCGGGLVVLATTLSCFYSGRGMTIPVMAVNMIGAAVNIPLDYALIYGWGIFPEMGIQGAGLATVSGSLVMVILFTIMIFTQENERCYGVISQWRFQPRLFKKFLLYGLPGGVNFFIDMFAITFFVFMIGRLGSLELAATNIVISLDLLAFLPVIGMSIGASVVVGHGIGSGNPHLSIRATYSAMHLSVIYMAIMGLIFVSVPEHLMQLFRDPNMHGEQFDQVVEMGKMMLRYVAGYSVIDAVVLTYFGSLKGAGDIRFVMWSLVVCSMTVMVVPIWILVTYTELGYHGPWVCLFSYVTILTVVAALRFASNKWQDKGIVEE